MAKYVVTLDLIITAPIKVIVEAADKDRAIELASSVLADSVAEAASRRSTGWGAEIVVSPPKGTEVAYRHLRASLIFRSSGGESASKVPE